MILSVSRRTDIPAFYSDWLVERLRAGTVQVRNPMDRHRIGTVALSPDTVDCIVFWSKDPAPLIDKLDVIDQLGYAGKYYFQFTLTPYGRSIETGLPDKSRLVDTFLRLSDKIGGERVVWRYDPIIIDDEMSPRYHADAFGKMATALAGSVSECVISFIDPYRKIKGFSEVTEPQMREIAGQFAMIAAGCDISIKTCAEKIDLSGFGIGHASCIDRNRIEKVIGYPLTPKIKRDGQRIYCGCVECIDIGEYDTCLNGCKYCYATHGGDIAAANFARHDPASPLLIGHPEPGDTVSERKTGSFKVRQVNLFGD